MNKDDVIRMAREVGYPLAEYEDGPYVPPMLVMLVEKAAAGEREACAKLCRDRAEDAPEAHAAEAWLCSAAIRARGQA